MKRLISILLLQVLLFTNILPAGVSAQIASSSATNSNPTSASEIDLDSFTQSYDTPTGSLEEQDSPSAKDLPLNLEAGSERISDRFRTPIKVRKLQKKVYRSLERVQVEVDNGNVNDFSVKVYDPNGRVVELREEVKSYSDPARVEILPPTSSFRPGKYEVVVEDKIGTTERQEFLWGVLAVNTNKSIYLAGDKALIEMAVLDSGGNMVCDTEVNLSITNPNGDISVRSTEDGGIKVNSECTLKNFTLIPDYEASYTVGGVGEYKMSLSAEIEGQIYDTTSTFEVRDSVDFDIERDTATRIYPYEMYPVNIRVTANQDFMGLIEEIVPGEFQIEQIEGDGIKFRSVINVGEDGKTEEFEDLDLGLPFRDIYPITQEFGIEETDPLLLAKYNKYGVIGHDGMDFALPIGTEVLSSADGTVSRARENYDYGTTIVTDHSWGKLYYGHLSELLVKEGDSVKKGQIIGKSGNTGLSTGPHLHLGLKVSDNNFNNGYFGKVNPQPYLASSNSLPNYLGQGFTAQANTEFKKIIWEVDVKKGETINLSYKYKAPLVSPYFYLIGPARLIEDDTEIFREARRWQIASDAVNNNGNFIYGDMADAAFDSLDFQTYTHTTTLGGESETVDIESFGNSAVSNVKMVAAPTRDEKIAAVQLDNGMLNILSCTGGCDASGDWTHIATHSAVAADNTSEVLKPWDIAYEQLSGLFTIVFYETGQTGELYYCQWDGANWTPATECDDSGTRPAAFAPGAGNNIDLDAILGSTVVEWVRLVPRGDRLTGYRTDEFLLGASDAGDDLFLAHWTGSAWEDQVNPLDDMSAQNAQKFDIAWEETTGEGLAVVTDDTAVVNLRYIIYDGTGWGSLQTSAEANNGAQAFNSWIDMASDPMTDDIAIFVADSGGDVEYFHWDGDTLQDFDATDDTAAEVNTGQHAQVEWTRFTSEAVHVFTDSNTLTSDMQCWQTGGGNYTAQIGDIGNPNISNGDDVDDASLFSSPNNDRMLLSRRAIDTTTTTGDDIEVLTYDGAGCADTDWVTVGEIGARGEGLNVANSVGKVHSGAYTPYSPWSLNWRFYDDETVDDPSTGLNGALENEAPEDVDQDEVIRLRINMSERGGMTQSDTRKILQYAQGSATCTPDTVENDSDCTWTAVGDTTETGEVWRYATSGETCTACTDGNTSNTPRLTDTTTGDPEVFYVSDKDAAADTDFDHTGLIIKEIDFPLVAENVEAGATYYFRLYEPRISNNGQDSPVYREQDDDGNNDCASATCTYPSLRITGAALDQLLRHGKWFTGGIEQPFTF